MKTKTAEEQAYGEVYDRFNERFWRNGWRYVSDSSSDLSIWKMQICATAPCDCFANVAEHQDQLGATGSFGVIWVDVLSKNTPPYCEDDLNQMFEAIECAEENLLAIGVPFKRDYKFHGKNDIEAKEMRNIQLRAEWKLNELEQLAGWGENGRS